MCDTWYTDMRNFLNETGAMDIESGSARKLAEHLAAIITMVTCPPMQLSEKFQVRCRRRPGRKRCTGMIQADEDPDTEEIRWFCPVCDDNGYIRNWQNTLWDLSSMDYLH